jgi:hypothetical protein
MDRSSFLSSLPFLIPIASSSWPPRTSNSNGNGGNGTTTSTAVRSERLLQDHYSISFEPVARNSSDTAKASTATTINTGSATTTAAIAAAARTLGPAFFGSSSLTTIENFDPALCSLEMVLEYTDNDHDNSNNNNNSNAYGGNHRGSSSYSSPMQQTHRHHNTHNNTHNNTHRHQNNNAAAVSYTGIAYVSLHGSSIFQLDLSELQSVQVQETDATTAVGSMQQHTPPCLLLKFSEVAVLRIFSLVAVPADEHFHLQGVCNKITTAASAASASSQSAYSSMMTSMCDAVASPGPSTSRGVLGSCSTGSSTDTGFGGNYRHDVIGAAEGEHNARQEDGQPSTSAHSAQKGLTHDDPEEKEENPRDRTERRIQRRRLAYDKSVAGMQALETVLDMPVSTFFADHPAAMTAQATASAILMDRVGPLLTAIGDDLTNAYARQGDKAQAMQACESNLAECRNSLDENLKSFFPLPRSKQRLLTTRTTTATSSSLAAARNGSNNKTDTGVDVDEIAEQVEELVQRQKEAVRKRHELFLLPSRG